MQKNVQINADVFVEDLGTGNSYVNLDRRVEVVTDEQTGSAHNVIIATEQYRVANPATRERIINTVMQENFPDGANEAALRKGIVNRADPDFVAFNTFAETLKVKCDNEIV